MELDKDAYRDSQSIRPIRIFYGLLMLNGFLLIFVLLFRSGEIQITDNFSLKFVSTAELFNDKETKIVAVDSVLKDVETLDTNESLSITEQDAKVKMPPISKRITFANKDSVNTLESFFKALYKTELTGKLIRILHYGDSQLEGDRVTGYLRQKMQMRFGGYGPGIILPIDISNSRISIRQSESPDWRKYSIYGNTQKMKNGFYGIGASTYKFEGSFAAVIGKDTVIKKVYQEIHDSIKAETTPTDTSKSKLLQSPVKFDSTKFTWDTSIVNIYEQRDVANSYLRFRNANKSYPRVRKYSQVRLMYNSQDAFSIYQTVDAQSQLINLPKAPLVNLYTTHSGLVEQQVSMSFKASQSPNIFGVFLDGDSGVAVDNFPMRGSSGLGFEEINPTLFKTVIEQANVKLIIMQYGINVVPNPQKSYVYYQKMFDAQLKAMRRANPNVSILVVGPSDMSRKWAGTYQSYPNIPLIRDAMRNAAFNNSCAFWDLYEAMGGENSMVAWVNNEPPLAGKDFTHFSHKGAEFVGEMLYNALISEYIEWKKTQTTADLKSKLP